MTKNKTSNKDITMLLRAPRVPETPAQPPVAATPVIPEVGPSHGYSKWWVG